MVCLVNVLENKCILKCMRKATSYIQIEWRLHFWPHFRRQFMFLFSNKTLSCRIARKKCSLTKRWCRLKMRTVHHSNWKFCTSLFIFNFRWFAKFTQLFDYSLWNVQCTMHNAHRVRWYWHVVWTKVNLITLNKCLSLRSVSFGLVLFRFLLFCFACDFDCTPFHAIKSS